MNPSGHHNELVNRCPSEPSLAEAVSVLLSLEVFLGSLTSLNGSRSIYGEPGSATSGVDQVLVIVIALRQVCRPLPAPHSLPVESSASTKHSLSLARRLLTRALGMVSSWRRADRETTERGRATGWFRLPPTASAGARLVPNRLAPLNTRHHALTGIPGGPDIAYRQLTGANRIGGPLVGLITRRESRSLMNLFCGQEPTAVLGHRGPTKYSCPAP